MRMAARLEAMGQVKYAGLTRRSGQRSVWTGKINLDSRALSIPEGWSKPKRVFVNSMSDLFHEKVPSSFITEVWAAMARAPQHTFQILTKRPHRMKCETQSLPILPNVWLGTSVEDRSVLDRLEELKKVRAAVKFVSFEPLIGSVSGAKLVGLHWAIVGGESGPSARPMNPEWVNEIEVMCRSDSVAFFFKQWGGKNKKATGRTLNGRTYDEMPDQISC